MLIQLIDYFWAEVYLVSNRFPLKPLTPYVYKTQNTIINHYIPFWIIIQPPGTNRKVDEFPRCSFQRNLIIENPTQDWRADFVMFLFHHKQQIKQHFWSIDVWDGRIFPFRIWRNVGWSCDLLLCVCRIRLYRHYRCIIFKIKVLFLIVFKNHLQDLISR